jgi:hypothetical protein
VNLPETHKGRWGTGLIAGDVKQCVGARPEVVAQIEYLEWTASDHLYLGNCVPVHGFASSASCAFAAVRRRKQVRLFVGGLGAWSVDGVLFLATLSPIFCRYFSIPFCSAVSSTSFNFRKETTRAFPARISSSRERAEDDWAKLEETNREGNHESCRRRLPQHESLPGYESEDAAGGDHAAKEKSSSWCEAPSLPRKQAIRMGRIHCH